MTGSNEVDLESLGRVAVFSRGISKIPELATLIGARQLVFRPGRRQATEVDAVIGWGHKPTATVAREYARAHGLPYVRLEDGFLRSADVSSKGRPLSLVLDDVGIYYDASAPSRLEEWLNAREHDPLDSSALIARAAACRRSIVEAKLSKYNNTVRSPPAWLKDAQRPIVLVVDQTFADASVLLASAGANAFETMLEAARADHPGATVVVKTHPDVWSGKKRGYFGNLAREDLRCLTDAVDPAELLEVVDRVYTVSSQFGFEALLRGVPVTCFGAPFYAGWGLTDDRVAVPRRHRTRNLDELVAAALIRYARYLHPVTRRPCDVETLIEHLALQRSAYVQNGVRHYCFGFSAWKRDYVRHYLKSPEGKVVFCRSVAHARRRGIDSSCRIVAWGKRKPPELDGLATELGLPIVTMEDGFIRSVGLGSDFAAPWSLVTDQQGIYYDATRPSDLERTLQNAEFSKAELESARAFVATIVRLGVTKYNFRHDRSERPMRPAGRRVILVPGQVEDDASIKLGSPKVRSNAELLREVRRLNPDAYIVYKVHPEVLSGNRKHGKVSCEAGLYDQLVERGSLTECLDAVDEVHTMTSLVGFEALLRGKRVVTYGQPFYAGWGLTVDLCPPERRTRRLTLPELVAGVMLRYPRYYSWNAECFTNAELAVSELGKLKNAARADIPSHGSKAQRSVRRALTWVRNRPGAKSPTGHVGLEGRHVLLLQGPVGPFFARLAAQLQAAGAEVHKVNFNAADDLFYRGPGLVRFKDRAEAWRPFIREFLAARGIDTIMLFGDTRSYHKDAIELASEVGIAVFVFEEGYVRPDYVTMERGGVNANSTLPKDLAVYAELATEATAAPEPVKHGHGMLALYSIVYSMALTFGASRYPHYRHHKDLNAWRMAPLWAKGFAKKAWFALTEREQLVELTSRYEKRFFLVPLQVYHDAQVVGSRFGSNEAFIVEVVNSFAAHGDSQDLLVFKHHPLDRAYSDYKDLIADAARGAGLVGRVRYVHDLHLPTLLRAAKGTVVLNSTTGLSSLHHGTPVKVLGDAVYDIAGLTFQGPLAEFWSNPEQPTAAAYRQFRDGLITASQLNGCFYTSDVADRVIERLIAATNTGPAEAWSGVSSASGPPNLATGMGSGPSGAFPVTGVDTYAHGNGPSRVRP
ncbi:MAG TPA: hypothetical protein VI197_01695 [Polyangiaceae bacterium]